MLDYIPIYQKYTYKAQQEFYIKLSLPSHRPKIFFHQVIEYITRNCVAIGMITQQVN